MHVLSWTDIFTTLLLLPYNASYQFFLCRIRSGRLEFALGTYTTSRQLSVALYLKMHIQTRLFILPAETLQHELHLSHSVSSSTLAGLELKILVSMPDAPELGIVKPST
jgi:hypothetical protein